MRNLCLSVGLCLFLSAEAQIIKTEQIVTPIIQERAISLNGGVRASIGRKSRETIKVDLPANTKTLYYSFTTKPGASGVSNLNLAIQLSKTLTMDSDGLTKSALKKISPTR